MVKTKPKLETSLYLSFALMCSALLLAGCFGPKTPQDVAKAFWQAVIDDNAQAVVKYSTLSAEGEFDRFDMNWHGYKPAWGKIIIDGDKASIVTEFPGPATSTQTQNRKCVTYLVRRNDVWKVDYTLTATDLHGGALGILFGKLQQLGDQLSRDMDASVNELNLELERLSRQFKEMTDSLSQQATQIIDKSAASLRNILQELTDSINRALQDKNNHLSDKDRQLMQEVSADLDNSRKKLSTPSTASITESNTNMRIAQHRVDSIQSGLADDYKKHWHALARQFEDVMQHMLDELAMLGKPNHSQQ